MEKQALSPEYAEAVSRLLEQKFEAQADQFEDGKCPELAIALASHLPQSRLCVGIRRWKEGNEYCTNQLSHVVVSSGTWDFDARGNWASLRWEAKWDEGEGYSEKPDEEVSFHWRSVTRPALIRRVRKYRKNDPEIDWNLVTELEKRFLELLSPYLSRA